MTKLEKSMLDRYFLAKQKIINVYLKKKLTVKSKVIKNSRLFAAIRYSLLNGGKRFRPILCLATTEVCGGNFKDALLPAIAIEAFHTYTLIHDDLPAMDDDKLRRGKPTCHIAFDEATAILAGDALQALAFEWLAQSKPSPPFLTKDLVVELASAGGYKGVVIGQAFDMEAEGKTVNKKLLNFIHFCKTALLIRTSIRIGAMVAGANNILINALSKYGENLGLAFQMADDILNAISTPDKLGKDVGTDEKRQKLTAVKVFGLEGAKKQLNYYTNKAIASLERVISLNSNSILKDIAYYNLERIC